MQSVIARYNTVKQNLIEAAEAMPENDYGYRLTPPQRPFGAWIGHTAAGNFNVCAAIKGDKPESRATEPKTKAELKAALTASFEYCDAALTSKTDQEALTAVDGRYPVNAMIGLIASLNEHYGNLVGYLRSKGITPPSTARTTKK